MAPSSRRLVLPVLALAALLAGCTTAPAGGGSSDGGGSAPAGGGQAAGPDCDGVTTGGFELFREPRLSVTPDVAVAPMTEAGERLEFVDSEFQEGTTYSYEYAYVADGSAFTQTGAPFFDSEGMNGVDEGGGRFRLEGPLELTTASGGPYAGIVTITATTSSSSKALANLCVLLPAG